MVRFAKVRDPVGTPGEEETQFCSQFGEDSFLVDDGRLPGRGVFVDIGAGDPIRFSNTYYLERRGWTGLCIDADPKQVDALQRSRTCAVEWAAITSAGEEARLLQCEDPDYSTTLEHLRDVAADKGWEYALTVVPATRLEELLVRHQIGKIDLLSIDTEGTELDVCASMDWRQHRPSVVVIEHSTLGRPSQEPQILDYFRDLPYRLLHRTACNFIFVESRLALLAWRLPLIRNVQWSSLRPLRRRSARTT
jgi:FkbM family methyltransferase